MTSSIPAEVRFRQLRKPKFFVIFLSVVFALAGVRAYAAPSVDILSATFSSFYYYTGQNSYSMTDASASNEIKIPLYCMYFGSDSPDESYLNGYIRTSLPGYTFSFNGSSIAPSYFEVDSAPGLSCSSPTANSNSMTIYFDNHLKQNNFYFILGYYVFNFSEYTNLSITVTPGSGLVQRDPSITTLYSSTSEFGLAQAIVTAINSASDIDIILNGLQDISDNTDLLNDVISGLSDNADLLTQIYMRLGQMQVADQTFYNNIDNIIDTVTWSSISPSLKAYNSSWVEVSGIVSLPVYIDVSSLVNRWNNLFLIRDFPTSNSTLGSYFTEYELGIFEVNTKKYYRISDIFKVCQSNASRSVICFYNPVSYSSDSYRIVIRPYYNFYENTDFNTSFLSSLSCARLTYDDIEYWTILEDLQLDNLYKLIESYINANVSQPVDQAATQAAGLAQNQAAAEQSLAALSPGKMEDLDSALQGMDILDSVQQSTTFWGYLIQQFSSRSGPLWGIFIFGLILGLIGFILRLRE